MEPTSSTRRFQDVENNSDRISSDCLGVPVILREILHHFSTTELIQLSLVSKVWNYEARSLMRSRGNLTAIINKNQTCQDLRAFASDLRRMKKVKKMVPFSGMTISIGGTKSVNKDYCRQSPSRELLPVYEEILGGLTWKHFTLQHLDGWEEHKCCPAFILQKKIMRRLDSVLEEFSVQLDWNNSKCFREEFLQDCYFPCLKTFRLLPEWSYSSEAEMSNLIRTVVFYAPNLQVLHTNPCVNLEANLLEGSTAVHMAGWPYSPSENEISEDVANKLRMQGMDLFRFGSDFSLERFNRITSMLLRSSNKIMSLMNADVLFLAPLIKYGVCLKNVRKFRLSLDPHFQRMQPHVWRIARSFDYTRMFPNLNAITISCNCQRSIPAEFNEMIEQVNVTLKTPKPDRAVNIKHLNLHYVPAQAQHCSSYFRFLAQMFPDIQRLSIETHETSFFDIRDIWVDLKQVDVTLRWSVHLLANLDSLFCGIFPEEVDQLRGEDEGYLQRVNIVPVMPSVAYLKEFRTLNVYYTNIWHPSIGVTRLLSKVTCLIAFQRCPDLTVTLTTEDERLAEALGHMRPYASIIFKKRTS